jgi:hypothetical protein
MKTASGMDGARENERQEEGQQMDVLILESPEWVMQIDEGRGFRCGYRGKKTRRWE